MTTAADAPATCDLKLSRGLELVGRLTDPDGQPVTGGVLECSAEGGGPNPWFAFGRADAQGRFAVANCPTSGTIRVSVRAQGFEELLRTGVDPKAGELGLQLARLAPNTVRITGVVVGPSGRPVANASVSAYRAQGRGGGQGIEATGNDGRFELGPYPPGTWSLHVRHLEHPEYRSERRELGADATWDVGTITLPQGGTAVLHQLGPTISGARFFAVGEDQPGNWTFGDHAGQLRSSVLAAGRYHVAVGGPGVAAQAVPFTIRAGEETKVEVQLQAGTTQRCECELPSGAKVPSVTLRFRRGETYCGRAWAGARPDQPTATEVWLAPGEYTVTAEAGELRGTAAFTVGAVPGSAVHITMR